MFRSSLLQRLRAQCSWRLERQVGGPSVHCRRKRWWSSDGQAVTLGGRTIDDYDESHVLISNNENNELLELREHDVKVFADIITEEEHDRLINDLLVEADDRHVKRFRKKRYELDHWDSVIYGYKEMERPLHAWNEQNRELLTNIQRFIHAYLKKHVANLSPDLRWLSPHIIDLQEDGVIKPHVDSVKFSGEVVSGLSLLSTRTMCLRPAQEDEHEYREDDPRIDILLPPRSLYILCNYARYGMAHSVQCEEGSDRRISIIFRDELVE